MAETHLVGFFGTGPLFDGMSIDGHKTFNHPPREAPTICPYCFLYPEFECPICKEN